MKPGTAQDYYRKLGLDGDPFPVAGVDQVLYLTPELERRLALIHELIHEGRQLLIVSGPHGAGKSRLSCHLESGAADNWISARIQARETMDNADLALAILKQVSPNRDYSPENAVSRLHQSLELAVGNDNIPVFIIDDAHYLPVATLDFILQLTEIRYEEKSFRFVLFAEESINDRFEDPAIMILPEGNIETIPLPALTETQTSEYIRHRILSYGHIKNDPFTEETINHIYRGSGGLPGGVNYLARLAIQSPSSEDNGKKMMLAGAFIVVVAAGIYVLMADKQSPPVPEPIAQAVPAPETPEPDTADTKAGAATPPVLQIGENTDAAIAAMSTEGESPPETTVIDNDTDPEPATEAGTVVAEEAEQAVADNRDINNDTPSRPAAPRQTPEQPATAPSSSPLVQPEKPAADSDSTASPGAAPRYSHVFDLAGDPDWTRNIRGESWLRQQPESSVLLQIISASELDNVRDLLSGLPELPETFSGFTNYTPSGKPRYRLYYGLYPDSNTAAEAVSGLPGRLSSLQPWPRPLTEILEELDNKNERFSGSE